MDKYQQLIEAIAKQTQTEFGPAPARELESLRALKTPEAAVRFYEQYEPATCAEDQVRLWPILDMVTENTMAVPGVAVCPLGYIVFASTNYGDSYCFNANKLDQEGEPEIVLISHETVGEDATPDEVQRAAKPVAKNSPAVFGTI